MDLNLNRSLFLRINPRLVRYSLVTKSSNEVLLVEGPGYPYCGISPPASLHDKGVHTYKPVRQRMSFLCIQDPTSVNQVFGIVFLTARVCRYLRPALSWVRGQIEQDLHVLQELEFNMDGVVHDLRETEPKTRCNGVAHPTLTSTALPNTHPESEIRERQDGFSRETTLREADVSIHLL